VVNRVTQLSPTGHFLSKGLHECREGMMSVIFHGDWMDLNKMSGGKSRWKPLPRMYDGIFYTVMSVA
jgi:hypothetical protein